MGGGRGLDPTTSPSITFSHVNNALAALDLLLVLEICPDTETVSASSSELVERSEAETSDKDISDVIPQLDGPVQETLSLTSDKAVMEEDSVKEEEVNLAHLPTADDPNSFVIYINNLNQEKIENMSKEEIIPMNAEIAINKN